MRSGVLLDVYVVERLNLAAANLQSLGTCGSPRAVPQHRCEWENLKLRGLNGKTVWADQRRSALGKDSVEARHRASEPLSGGRCRRSARRAEFCACSFAACTVELRETQAQKDGTR